MFNKIKDIIKEKTGNYDYGDKYLKNKKISDDDLAS